MGTYRLFLAILVVLSHLQVTAFGLDVGVEATISFFLLSGFVMTALIRKSYETTDRVGLFFIDRLMRLYPQYFLYVVATLAFVALAHPTSAYLQDITSFKVFLNFLMVPMGFFEFGLVNCMLIVPAWTLGLECTFYLMAPYLLIYHLRLAAAIVSALIFAAAYFAIIDTNLWGYRLLPGTLFIFLTGSLMHDRKSAARNVVLLLAWLVALGMLLAIPHIAQTQKLWNPEVLTGFVVGLPAVVILSRLRSGKLDAALGNLSYGVFLNHGLIILFGKETGLKVESLTGIAIVLTFSLIFAAASYYFLERPVVRRRYALRNRSNMAILGGETAAP